MNGRVESITARSARGGRFEFFSTSTIINELLEMLAEFNEASQDVAQHRYAPAKVEAEHDSASADDTASNTSTALLGTLKMVGGMVMINMIITLATLGIVWYNL